MTSNQVLLRIARSFRRSPIAIVSLITIVAFVMLALLAEQLAPHSPTLPSLAARLLPPAWISGDWTYLLGTDQLGRDLLSRLIFGSRIALTIAVLGVLLAAVIGVTLGTVAGYFGGLTDTLISRGIDALLAIPNIILYLAVLFAFGPSLMAMVLVIGGVNWTTFARVVRAEVLTARHREYVDAAHAIGQPTSPIIWKHILPNVLAPILVVGTLNVSTVIILEASLSFLGLGVQPPAVTWGRMLADGRAYVATSWWLAAFPGLMITMLCLCFIALGDWLRDVVDPRVQGR